MLVRGGQVFWGLLTGLRAGAVISNAMALGYTLNPEIQYPPKNKSEREREGETDCPNVVPKRSEKYLKELPALFPRR